MLVQGAASLAFALHKIELAGGRLDSVYLLCFRGQAALENVQLGAPVGRVGNSGNTSMPHLHILLSKCAAVGGGVFEVRAKWINIEATASGVARVDC
jgi:hypothetical protein